jgi:hypothetical protein
MIVSDSRYVTGLVTPQPDKTVTVRRLFPRIGTEYVLYTWKSSDRIDRVAANFLGKPQYWWRIMDINPLVQDPHDIQPGEQIRIPRRA